jgi:hypothetical protein
MLVDNIGISDFSDLLAVYQDPEIMAEIKRILDYQKFRNAAALTTCLRGVAEDMRECCTATTF